MKSWDLRRIAVVAAAQRGGAAEADAAARASRAALGAPAARAIGGTPAVRPTPARRAAAAPTRVIARGTLCIMTTGMTEGRETKTAPRVCAVVCARGERHRRYRHPRCRNVTARRHVAPRLFVAVRCSKKRTRERKGV